MQWNDNMDEAPRDGLFIVSHYGHVIGDAENWLDTEFKCFFSERCGRLYNCTAWMPLPEPPR